MISVERALYSANGNFFAVASSVVMSLTENQFIKTMVLGYARSFLR